MLKVLFLNDIFSHPYDYIDTNHDWVIDMWLYHEKYKVTKFSEIAPKQVNLHQFLPKKPYSILDEKSSSEIAFYLESILGAYDLIIAFECKHETRIVLDKLHNKVLFSFFSQYRFADRLTFSFFSNNTKLQHKIETIGQNAKSYYAIQANYVKHLILNNTEELPIKDDSILLIGQVETDLAVWDGNRYLNLDSYKERINDLISNESNVYYKAHPFSIENNSGILDDPNIITINEDIYKLLSSGKIKKVITVSSSVASEAQCFNIESEQFFDGYIPNEVKNIPYTQDKNFWDQLLNENPEVDYFNFEVDRIDVRPIRKAYWGYKTIMHLQSSESQELQKIKKAFIRVKLPKFLRKYFD